MDLLKTIFEKQYELNKRILKNRHGKDYDDLCDQSRQDKDTVKNRVNWILNYNRAQIHESIELSIRRKMIFPGNGGRIWRQ